ncbi:MAG: GNAT family protein [Salaquimonas sp.]
MNSLNDWTSCDRPSSAVLKGNYVTLERLSAEKHGDELYVASTMPDADQRFRWLFEYPPESRGAFQSWLEMVEKSLDPLFYAVIDHRSGKVAGRQTLMRIDEKNGVIETGSIFWSSIISQTPATTEAFYLFAKYVFEDLGYRRFEWKCNNRNEPSKNAALRYGMKAEGVFRQHMIVKNENRDTSWFSMLDSEWPICKAAFDLWLHPENFDENGLQKRKLGEIRGYLQAV